MAPPATILDKFVYSPSLHSGFQNPSEERGTDTVIVTGGESEMCLLSTVLEAIDYRTVIVNRLALLIVGRNA